MSELNDTSVNVTVVFPGAINTNIVKNAQDVSEEEKAALTKSSNRATMTSPEKAARLIIKAIENNKRRLYIGSDAKVMNFLTKIAPKTTSNLVRSQLKKFLGTIKDS